MTAVHGPSAWRRSLRTALLLVSPILMVGTTWATTASPRPALRSGTVARPSFLMNAPGPSDSARLPRPVSLSRHPRTRQSWRSTGQSAAHDRFHDVDQLAADQPHQALLRPDLVAQANERLLRLADLRGLPARPGSLATEGCLDASRAVPEPEEIATGMARRETPWTADHLLANPTNMNDTYVSLEVSPTSGHLYAVFDAFDLGMPDRDIHIARSQDDGLSWEVWELPSSSLDEYQPDLAIDGAGYLYVVWIRADGAVVRARSDGPDDPVSWAWVQAFVVGEPCATPAIAVSGAGDFSTLFVATSWLTFNWDVFDYEWTLLWFYSPNGGATISYDYLLPDGYPDLWPDVAIDGGTVYLVNGEQDYDTGVIEILIAADSYSGTFADIVWLSEWTEHSCGFPSVAAEGQDVYCVYQVDFEDGLGNVDGDIIYSFSWDGVQNVYGPYELIADPAESVGPVIYCRDSVVGCLWLEAPPGADEFDLVARQASLFGHPDFWSEPEIVTDDNHVYPMYHGAAGAAAAGRLHAAWIDLRDFTTAGTNVYTSERGLQANLVPYTPEGWGGPLVASVIAGQLEDGPLGAQWPCYVSFALVNDGFVAAGRDFTVHLTLDGVAAGAWLVEGGLGSGVYVAVEDFELTADVGLHEIEVLIDVLADVHESDETDNNVLKGYYFLDGEPDLRLEPTQVVQVFSDPVAGSQRVSELVAQPPSIRQVNMPVVSLRLNAALTKASRNELLHVVIEPAERIDTNALTTALAGLAKVDRRRAVREICRAQLARASADLGPVFAELAQRGQLDDLRELWLPGAWCARLTGAAVAELATRPQIGRLWLDDVKSTAFAGGSERATAGRPSAALRSPEVLAWHLTWIGAEEAWSEGLDGSGVVIGHTDTGAAYDHPDLAGQLWQGGPGIPNHGWDFLNEDDDPYDGDGGWWHGTHTAGLLVGDGTGGTATGAAPGARLMVVRCVPGYYEDLVQGLQFCLDEGADLISFSAGWGDADDALRAANRDNAAFLLSAGIPWICAAGNGTNTGSHYPVPRDIATPADCPHPWYGAGGHSAVITVTACDAAGIIWPDASIGPTAWNIAGDPPCVDYPYPPGLIKPDLAAPGVDIKSTVGSSGYAVYDGTSMATPLVAGAAAILLQAVPELSVSELARLLEETADDLDDPGRDNRAGAGRVDLVQALSQAPAGSSAHAWAHNTGLLPLQILAVTEAADWLEVSPLAAVIAPGDSLCFTLRFFPEGYGSGAYHATVMIASTDPDSPCSLPVRMIIGEVTGVGDPDPLPRLPVRLDSRPNPFNPRTVLRFATSTPGLVQLDIFDLRGWRVRRLSRQWRPAGEHEMIWDGRDDAGHAVGSGTYVARLQTPAGSQAVRKLTLLR